MYAPLPAGTTSILSRSAGGTMRIQVRVPRNNPKKKRVYCSNPPYSTEFMQRITPASPKQVLFEQFSKQAMNALLESTRLAGQPRPLVLLTGGLRSPAHFSTALSSSHADLLGVGRGAILRPDFPDLLANRIGLAQGKSTPDTDAVAVEPCLIAGWDGDGRRVWLLLGWLSWCWEGVGGCVWRRVCPSMPLVGAGVDVAWYTVAMRRWAVVTPVGGPTGVVVERGKVHEGGWAPELDCEMSGIGAVVRMWVFAVWTEDEIVRWTRGGIVVTVLVLLLVLKLVVRFMDDQWCFRS